MTVRSLGSLSVAQVSVGVGLVLPMLSLYQKNLITKLVDIQASLQVSLGFGLPDPAQLLAKITALAGDIDDILNKLPTASFIVQADLTTQIAANIAETAAIAALVAQLTAALSSVGVSAYRYDGPERSLPGELGAYLSSSEQCHALVLVARDPAAWAALSTVIYTG